MPNDSQVVHLNSVWQELQELAHYVHSGVNTQTSGHIGVWQVLRTGA